MKKMISSKEAGIQENVENWSVNGIAEVLGLNLTHNQYPSISDQEVEVWENIPEPWALDSEAFKSAFFEYFQYGGDKID